MAFTLRTAALAAILTVLADAGAISAPPTSCPPRFTYETAQLTDAAIGSNTALFGFGAAVSPSSTIITKPPPSSGPACKVFPGDAQWPSDTTWAKFNTTLGGALIKTVPLAAPCYTNWPQHDPAACQVVRDRWNDPHFHVEDPTSAMFPIYQGRTCMPTDDPAAGNCTLGGYASYSVAVTKVAHVQLALNFARNANIRLAVRNTGHDFGDKSIGAGALSVWTHKLKDIQYVPDYNCKGHTGPAFKLGAGVVTEEVYAAAEKNQVTVVGGECRTVGIAGGYIAGGGHSPMAALVGMGADQVLSMEVVLPNGRFVTVDEDSYPDLYWALRGGGGSKLAPWTPRSVSPGEPHDLAHEVAFRRQMLTLATVDRHVWRCDFGYRQGIPQDPRHDHDVHVHDRPQRHGGYLLCWPRGVHELL